jgi:hypothetical protein
LSLISLFACPAIFVPVKTKMADSSFVHVLIVDVDSFNIEEENDNRN